jgi:hypothetical protein
VKLRAACQVGAFCSIDAGGGMDLTGFEQIVQLAYIWKRSKV